MDKRKAPKRAHLKVVASDKPVSSYRDAIVATETVSHEAVRKQRKAWRNVQPLQANDKTNFPMLKCEDVELDLKLKSEFDIVNTEVQNSSWAELVEEAEQASSSRRNSESEEPSPAKRRKSPKKFIKDESLSAVVSNQINFGNSSVSEAQRRNPKALFLNANELAGFSMNQRSPRSSSLRKSYSEQRSSSRISRDCSFTTSSPNACSSPYESTPREKHRTYPDRSRRAGGRSNQHTPVKDEGNNFDNASYSHEKRRDDRYNNSRDWSHRLRSKGASASLKEKFDRSQGGHSGAGSSTGHRTRQKSHTASEYSSNISDDVTRPNHVKLKYPLPNTWEEPKVGWEEDERIITRREKEIKKAKDSAIYRQYCNEIPRKSRVKGVHPRTPNKMVIYSRRSWDMQIRIWKKMLHFFNRPTDFKIEDMSFSSLNSSIVTDDNMTSDDAGSSLNNSVTGEQLAGSLDCDDEEEVDQDYTPSFEDGTMSEDQMSDSEVDEEEIIQLKNDLNLKLEDDGTLHEAPNKPAPEGESTMTGLVSDFTNAPLDFSKM